MGRIIPKIMENKKYLKTTNQNPMIAICCSKPHLSPRVATQRVAIRSTKIVLLSRVAVLGTRALLKKNAGRLDG
jgi:hypothetical protein